MDKGRQRRGEPQNSAARPPGGGIVTGLSADDDTTDGTADARSKPLGLDAVGDGAEQAVAHDFIRF